MRRNLPADVLIKKFLSKVKDQGPNAVSKIRGEAFDDEMIETQFLKKVWNKISIQEFGRTTKIFPRKKGTEVLY